jgi:hypothetical protein
LSSAMNLFEEKEERKKKQREKEIIGWYYKIFKEKRQRREEGLLRTPNPNNKNPARRLHSSWEMQGLFLSLFSLSFQEERNGWNVFSKARLFLYVYIYSQNKPCHVLHYNMVL